MIHKTFCPNWTHSSTNTDKDCDFCRNHFEKSQHVCPHCWKSVSNAAYFGKRGNSPHIDGKCAEKQTRIPPSWFARTTGDTVALSSYWTSSKYAEESIRAWRRVQPKTATVTYVEPETFDAAVAIHHRIAELTAQNEAIRKLLAA